MVDAIDGVARTSATDVDERVQAEPRKGFFVRLIVALRESRRRQCEPDACAIPQALRRPAAYAAGHPIVKRRRRFSRGSVGVSSQAMSGRFE